VGEADRPDHFEPAGQFCQHTLEWVVNRFRLGLRAAQVIDPQRALRLRAIVRPFDQFGHRARPGRTEAGDHFLHLATLLKNEVDPFVVEVSLHGATAATHERQTRVPGSFDRLLANLDAMKSVGLRVKINSTLTRWNEGEIRPMFALADRLGLVLQMDPEVTPKDDGDESPLSLSPTREGLLALYRFDEERAGGGGAPAEPCAKETPAPPAPDTGGKHCGAGSNNVAIDPYGNVYPCVQWRVSVGNLYDESLKSIFARSPRLAALRELNRQVKTEVGALGPDAALMSFCPGVALGVTGSALSVHPAALDRLALRREARGGEAGAVHHPLALPSLARP
jgi:hypothetical protein